MPSPSPSALPSPAMQPQMTSLLQCKWSGCYATFSSLSDLVGHVNLQHLRIPGPSPAFSDNNAPFLTPHGQHGYPPQNPADGSLACMWGDCQLYPSSQSIPGPSSGDPLDVLGILTSHLLQDHLGLTQRKATFQQDPSQFAFAPQAPSTSQSGSTPASSSVTDLTPDGSPPTPIPEHDCSSSSSHICRWTGCGQSFTSCDALTDHIASAHIGSGRAHYDCFWEGCTRHGDNGFASKQKISRHMQVSDGRTYAFVCAVLIRCMRSRRVIPGTDPFNVACVGRTSRRQLPWPNICGGTLKRVSVFVD